MGKNKAQRTKNNAKPSNSSRSAELLGSSVPNFVGFSAARDGGYVPVLPGLSISASGEGDINSINPEFRLVLKKMNKKDPITKFKALQEFTYLCENAPMSSVTDVLPLWPRNYCVLAVDIEHRVREASQVAHSALVHRVGRTLALYLKQLAGCWYTSQFDTYPPAASAALNSFDSTFPEAKAVPALIHCQCEILGYIQDNILPRPPQSVLTQKTQTPEETEAKEQRTLICCLQGYAHYLKQVPLAQITQTMDINQKIISSPTFWKLGRHKVLLIRTAFFHALASIVSNAPAFLHGEKKRAMTIIMNSLAESDPGILSAVWECALVAIDKIEDWQSFVSIEKLVLPKLWKILRSGGEGSASAIYPNFLPFLSKFPTFDIENKSQLFINFFENMRQGFSVKTVVTSKSEMLAVATAFVECLKYTIILNNQDNELCKALLKDQLMPIVESSINDFSPTKTIIFREVANLIKYWSKNRNNDEYNIYSELIQTFWEQIESVFHKINTTALTSHNKLIIDSVQMAEIKFLSSLKNPENPIKKNKRVRFIECEQVTGGVIEEERRAAEDHDVTLDEDNWLTANEDAEVTSDEDDLLEPLTPDEDEPRVPFILDEDNPRVPLTLDVDDLRVPLTLDEDEVFRKELEEFVSKLCVSYIQRNKDDKSDTNIIYLTRLLCIFESKDLFLSLAQRQQENGNLLNFYNDNLKPLLESGCQEAIALTFTVWKYMSDEEKEHVLNSLNSLQSKILLNSALTCALRPENRRDNLIKDWLRTPRITEYLTDICNAMILQGTVENIDMRLLLLVFESTDGELTVNDETVNKISEILCSVSSKSEYKILENVTALISKLLELTWAHTVLSLGALKMLKTLFELNLNEKLSVELKESIQEKWKNGFVKIQQKIQGTNVHFIEVQRDCYKLLLDRLYGSDDTNIGQLIKISIDFIESSNNYKYHKALSTLSLLNLEHEVLASDWLPRVITLVLQGELISGNFYLPNSMTKIRTDKDVIFITPAEETPPDMMGSCLKWALLNAHLINHLIVKLHEEDLDQDSLKECLMNLPSNLKFIILITSLGTFYRTHYRHSKNYDCIAIIHDQLDEQCKKLKQEIPRKVWKKIVEAENVETYCNELGSVFNEFLRYFYGNDESSVFIEEEEEQFLEDYLNEQTLEEAELIDPLKKPLGYHMHALIISRRLLCGEEPLARPLKVLKHFISLHKKGVYSLHDGEKPANIAHLSLSEFHLRLEFVRLFTDVIRKVPEIDDSVWDSAMIYLLSWLLSIQKSKENHEDGKVRCFISAVSDFFFEFQVVLRQLSKEKTVQLPENLKEEWKEIFARDVNEIIVKMWMFYADLLNLTDDHLAPVIVLHHLGKTLTVLDTAVFRKNSSRINTDQLMEFTMMRFTSSLMSIQISCFYLLTSLIPEMVDEDKAAIDGENFNPNTLNFMKLRASLLENEKIVHAMLIDFSRHDPSSYIIQSHTDSYTYTLAYLLEWMVVLKMCKAADADLRYNYAESLKNELFPNLMHNLFRLMPMDILRESRSRGIVDRDIEIFKRELIITIDDNPSAIKIDEIVCSIYIECLRQLPALARQWWSTADSRISSIMERVTTIYVSPILCREELSNEKLKDMENLHIKVLPNVRTVIAFYQMDDTKLELSMALPVNYPLGHVVVESGQEIGGKTTWKNYHKQLSIFLTHQNGSISEGLNMWKTNLDRKFAGVEECYICFSIFHYNTYKIPKIVCRTCKKKYHARCLYKWFTTSQKPTCPICRNVF